MKKQKLFEKLFLEFYDKCLEDNIVPMAQLGSNTRSLYAYIGYIEVTDKQKEDIKRLEKEKAI